MECSRAQEALWLAEQVSDIDAANNMPLVVELLGELDVHAINAALAAVIESQPALHTRFEVRNGRLVATHESRLSAPTLAAAPVGSAAARIIAERCRTPLTLLEEPVRYSLLKAASDRHLLLAEFHHAIFDGLSKELFVDDLATAYAAVVTGASSPLEPRPGYARYVADERRHIASLATQAERYWRAILAQLPESAGWPRSPHAASAGEARGEAFRFELGPSFKARLDRLAGVLGVSLFVVLTAAVQTLQHIYAGRSDERIATLLPMSTRPRYMAKAIGMFVNEAPLLARPGGTFRDFVAHVAAETRRLFALRLFPFNEATARFAAGVDPRALVPRVGISYWKSLAGDPVAGGVRYVPDRQTSVYGRRWDVRFRFLEHPGGVTAAVEYDTSVLHAAGARRLAGHLRTLLARVAASPDAPVHELSVLPAREWRRIERWNQTALPLPDRTLPELFEKQLALRSDHVAAIAGTQQLTYSELNRRANRLAHRLSARGAEPGRIVAIHLSRDIDLLAAMLAVSKSGAAFLALDPGYPRERLDFMLRDSRAAMVITSRSTTRETALPRVDVDDPTPAPEHDPRRTATLDDPAYVIYTSGSTGRPKGAVILHRGLANLVQSVVREPGLGPHDTQLAVASVSFDLAVLELFAPLVAGGRVIIAAADDVADGHALATLVRTLGVTYVHATPATWRLLIAAGWRGLRTAVSGAEPLTTALARELLDRADAVWNSYGPTETTVASSYQRIKDPRRIAIGHPIANTQMLVVDRAGQPVPLGVPGELHIGGAGVARGYLDRPKLTRDRFVTGPSGARVYRSGDLVRQRDDGALEFLRRIDDQIKIRGFRIEPGEIEVALTEQRGVRHALVVAHEASDGNIRLVAYLVPSAGRAPAPSQIRRALARRLPDHMIPTAYVVLDEFPVGPSGKVDRRRLPAPEITGAGDDAPRTPIEAELRRIWTELLGCARVGVRDNFFELGGHSLLAAQVAARATDALDRQVPVRLVFRHPTIAELASAIDEAQLNRDSIRAIPAAAS